MVTDVSVIGGMLLCVRINEALDLMNHLRTVTVEREDIRQTGTQLVEDRDLTSAAFVHHRYTHAVAERAAAVHKDRVHVLDAGVAADVVIGDVVVDVVQMAVVAHFAVMQRGIVDTRVDF